MSHVLKIVLQAVVLGLAAAFLVVWLRPDLVPRGAGDEPTSERSRGYADAVSRTAPSVVSIYTRTLVSEPVAGGNADAMLQRLFQGRRVQRPRNGLGSGVIVSPDGLIVTAAHVIREVDNIFVALFDGGVAEARVIGTDPATDVAVLKVDLTGLPAATFNTDGGQRPGDIVLAIGNAFGLNHTVTAGIISATGRSDLNLATFEDFIQTDAAINSGNSGGALINLDGEVIGINTASLSQDTGAQGIGFAIPAGLAVDVMRQIVEYGSVRRGWIGANVTDPRLVLLEGREAPGGVQIAQLYRGGPAWQAGLRPGDIIVAVDEKLVADAREFMLEVANQPPGAELELIAVRDGQRFTTSVRVIQQPPL
ncbi:MAG: trypsin-like peptidase domain-containing protein [Wenzhouxiangellaceae bacterium]|nr:trypsin-like peptidase domain-containing protein [Wenzhouxiangellaceae bacterium]